MDRRRAAIRKSDLAPTFEAAKAAGYDQVSVIVETADGKRFQITAGSRGGKTVAETSPLENWRASRGNN